MGSFKNGLNGLSTYQWVMLDATGIVIATAFTDAIEV
jgi:ribosomal silencing factor RsfS